MNGITKKFEGWFASSFWVDVHYCLAAAGTFVIFAVYVVTRHFDVAFASFVTGMWTTAIANDRLNLPALKATDTRQP